MRGNRSNNKSETPSNRPNGKGNRSESEKDLTATRLCTRILMGNGWGERNMWCGPGTCDAHLFGLAVLDDEGATQGTRAAWKRKKPSGIGERKGRVKRNPRDNWAARMKWFSTQWRQKVIALSWCGKHMWQFNCVGWKIIFTCRPN